MGNVVFLQIATNLGYLFENIVAQMLTASGNITSIIHKESTKCLPAYFAFFL